MVTYQNLIANRPDLFNNQNAMIQVITNSDEIASWEETRVEQLRAEGKPEEWAKIGIVYSDPYIFILRDLVEFANGARNSYFRIMNQDELNDGHSVIILPEMDGKFLLLHQFRHPTRSWHYEVTRGFGEAGTPPETQAKNEIFEEVGGEIAELIDLGDYYSNTGIAGSSGRLFYARLSSVGKPAVEEGIEQLIWVSVEELERMIANSEITDGFTIAAYTRAKLRGLIK